MVSAKKTYKLVAAFIIVFILPASIIAVFKDKAAAPASNILAPPDQPEKVNSQKFEVLSGEQFHQTYLLRFMPNTTPIIQPPKITDNPAADARILELARARGFRLGFVPESGIVKTDEKGLEGDDLLQPLAYEGWQQMKRAAADQKITLTLTSAYRPISYQRSLFLSRLSEQGTNIDQIADGSQDTTLLRVLEQAAPPGFSRHHSGYTIDLACDKTGLHNFKNTPCFRWLSDNNYRNAREFGWIPSYPEGAGEQGPEPEPWEFVWVGNGF